MGDIEEQLAELRQHWGAVYQIRYGNGLWTATRRKNGTTLYSYDPDKLSKKMREDYQRTNPRQLRRAAVMVPPRSR